MVSSILVTLVTHNTTTHFTCLWLMKNISHTINAQYSNLSKSKWYDNDILDRCLDIMQKFCAKGGGGGGGRERANLGYLKKEGAQLQAGRQGLKISLVILKGARLTQDTPLYSSAHLYEKLFYQYEHGFSNVNMTVFSIQ